MIGYNAGTIKVTEWSTGGGGAPDPGVDFLLVSLSNYEVARTVHGTVEQVTDKDAIINRTSGTTIYRDQQMQLSYVGAPEAPVVWTSSDEAVATVDSDGFVTHFATGTTTITATVGAQSLQKVLNLAVSTLGIVDELVDYVEGSLAKSASDAIDDLIEGKSASAALKIFTTQDHVTPTYVRNGDFWGASLGSALCAISPWNTSGGPTRAGVAISDLHILFAAHYQIGAGATVRFVLADNTVVSRTLVSRKTHPEYTGASTGYAHDLTVGLLDSPLPAEVVPVKILPADYKNYLPGLSSQRSLPALCLDQEEKGLVTDLIGLVGLTSMATFSYPNRVNWEKRAEFYESKISGDSGNPAFLIVNGGLVLLTVWTFGGAGSGTSIVHDKNAINLMMSQLGGGRQLTEADLSGFTNFVHPPVYDADAQDYFDRVASAGSSISLRNKAAVDQLVRGLKAEGLWEKLGTALLLAGPDTLAGALVPLRADMPTPTSYNFVEGDYARATGLKGNGTNKYLNSGYVNSSDPQNDASRGVWVNVAPAKTAFAALYGSNLAYGCDVLETNRGTNDRAVFRSRSFLASAPVNGIGANTGLWATSRTTGSVFARMAGVSEGSHSVTSEPPDSETIFVFGRWSAASVSNATDARLGWFHAGAAADLAALRAVLSAYMAALV